MVTQAQGNNTYSESDTKSLVFKTSSHVVVVVLLVGIFGVIFCCLGGKELFPSPIDVCCSRLSLMPGWQCTLCSKSKYTLCFPVSTQNVAGAGPPAVLRDSQSESPNNQATVCGEIPNGSKVLRESLPGCCVRKFTKICFCH